MKFIILIVFVTVFSFVLCETTISKEYHHCHAKISFGKRNLFPILEGSSVQKLVRTVKNGKLFSVTIPNGAANATSSFHVTHVWGSPYEMGFARGTLLKKESHDFATKVWAYLVSQVEEQLPNFPEFLRELIARLGLEAALDATAIVTRPYTGDYFFEEMRGIADAANFDVQTLVRIHMLTSWWAFFCSLFASWSHATVEQHVVQYRALDWDMEGPFRDFSEIVFYHIDEKQWPDGAHDFINVGFVGFVGGLTGISESHLGISQIGVSFPDGTFGSESHVGEPFIFMLRDILAFDDGIDDAISRLSNTKRTCDLILAVGDGRAGYARGFESSHTVLDVFDAENMRPDNSTWHPKLNSTVYWGMDWLCPAYSYVLSQQLTKFTGKLTAPLAISDVISVTKSGDLHVAVYDLTTNDIWVSFASPHGVGGAAQAYDRQFVHYAFRDMQAVTQ